jgi:hypothetical protein
MKSLLKLSAGTVCAYCPLCLVSTQLKALFYIFYSMAEDEETQRRGVVGIAYFIGQKFGSEMDFDLSSRAPRLLEWIPFRVSAMHFCSDDPRLRAFNALILPLLGQRNRARFRIHDGMLIWYRGALVTYIPSVLK